jgi:GT2 family glycosyltransferase
LGLGDISARVGRATLAEHFFAEAIFADTLCEGSYLRLKEALVKRVTSLYRVSIVIPTYRQVHDLQECITSLREHSFYPLEIIVVSEPDDTETATYLDTQREAPDLIALRNDTRLGSVKSINKGFKVARGDIVGLLNDDVRVMPAWDLALVDIFERVPSAGSCSSLVLNPDGTIQSVGMYISHKSSRFPWIGQVEWVYTKPVINHSIAKFPAFHLPRECDYGYFPFLKRECFEKIGRVDERFRHYFVDPDIGYQVQQLGYKNILCPTSVVFHYHLGDKDTPEREAIGRADWEEFSRKWALRGMTPGEVKGIRVMSVEEPMTYLKTAIRQLRDAL